MKKKNKVVLLQGTFDILNWGHCKAFEMCKTFGNHLIVALNTDKLVRSFKQREPVLPYYQKKFILESNRYVDQVVSAPNFSPIELLEKYDVDVYCLTQEWEHTKAKEIAYMKAKGGEVRFLPRFKGVICTSDIKKTLLEEANNHKTD